MMTPSAQKIKIGDVLRAFMETVDTPLLKTEMCDGIRKAHPYFSEDQVMRAIDYARTRRKEIIGDGKIPSRYVRSALAIAANTKKNNWRAEIVRPFVAGIREPLTPRTYDLRGAMELAMLVRR